MLALEMNDHVEGLRYGYELVNVSFGDSQDPDGRERNPIPKRPSSVIWEDNLT